MAPNARVWAVGQVNVGFEGGCFYGFYPFTIVNLYRSYSYVQQLLLYNVDMIWPLGVGPGEVLRLLMMM